MTHDWITTLLALGFFAATAAFFVMWSKLEEQKQKTAEAEERRWDEISRAVEVEKELDKAKREYEQAVLFWRDTAEESVEYEIQRDALQDKLSALLCPHNDHVWKDGVCVKCGRVKDGWGCSDECPCSL